MSQFGYNTYELIEYLILVELLLLQGCSQWLYLYPDTESHT